MKLFKLLGHKSSARRDNNNNNSNKTKFRARFHLFAETMAKFGDSLPPFPSPRAANNSIAALVARHFTSQSKRDEERGRGRENVK